MSLKSNLICPAPRVGRACDRCRSTKARCLPSQQASSCHRCLEKGYSCVFLSYKETTRARGRAHSFRTDHHADSIPEAGRSSNPIESFGFQKCNSKDTKAPLYPLREVEDVYTHHREVLDDLFRSEDFLRPTEYTKIPWQSTNDSIDAGSIESRFFPSAGRALLDIEIENHLHRYESVQRLYFPFLPAPHDWSVQEMKQNHPFFLLGILTAMTQHQLKLNSQLHKQFLRVLAERVVMKAEKSLDLVQGMIAQLAWYPMHLEPRKSARHIFQILQIAASMISDLGFDRLEEQRGSSVNTIFSHLDQRTQVCIACSYISSIASVSFQRPNYFALTEHVLSNRSWVCFGSNYDPSLSSAVYSQALMQRIAEQVDRIRREKQVDSHTLCMTLESLQGELKYALGFVHRKGVNEVGLSVRLTIQYAESQINSIVFEDKDVSACSDQNWVLRALARCLESAKSFLEIFLSLSIPEYRNLSFVQWAQLVQVLKLIPKLCFDGPQVVPGWDLPQIREDSKFGTMLESLCYRLHELTSTDPSQSVSPPATGSETGLCLSQPDYFLMFKSVLQILKESYDKRCRAIEQECQMKQQASRCPVLNGSIRNSEFWEALQHTNTMECAEVGDEERWALDFDTAIESWEWNNIDWLGLDGINMNGSHDL